MADATPMPPATEPVASATPDKPQDPKVEEPKSPSPKQDPSAASRFALAARREQAAQRAAQAVRTERAQLEQMRRELEAERARLQSFRQDPLAAIRESGVNLDPQTQALMGTLLQNGANTPEAQIAALGRRLDELASARAEDAKRADEARQKADQDARTRADAGYRSELARFAKGQGEVYEFSAMFDPEGAVAFNVAQELYRLSAEEGDPRIPEAKDVMDRVEAYFEEQFGKVADTKKFAAKFGAKFGPKPPEPPKTLSNTMVPSQTNGEAAKTEAERFARALAKLGG